MTEPTLTSQLLGILTFLTIIFVLMILITAQEERERAKKRKQQERDELVVHVYQEGLSQFNNIARENIRNCDRKFTYDTEKPEGLRPELLALPYTKG